ncbi:MAG: heparinase II/III family protein, partial [Patescibacteria group bacterium]|nr:heparinase II/III family protein [Patescibacteria group bacterium]
GLHLQRADFYEKELSFQVSCSYGPGRYDAAYEEQGHDYPIGYVRWTEQRNFEAVLDLMRDGRLDTAPLVSRRVPFAEAGAAYNLLDDKSIIGVLLRYPEARDEKATERLLAQVVCHCPPRREADSVVCGILGAGGFAMQKVFPALVKTGVRLKWVATAKGFSGAIAATKFNIEQSTTECRRVLDDPEVNAVVIATRHDCHADLVVSALDAGKSVFVEKPLCLSMDDLARIEQAHAGAGRASALRPILMVGYNRRFAPLVQALRAQLAGRRQPLAMIYTCNAGAIPADHWTQDPAVGGGRLLGEACHFIDLLHFLADESPIEHVTALRHGVDDAANRSDTVAISLRMADGSLGQINYFANGAKSLPKERLEVFSEGRVLRLDNFRRLEGFGCLARTRRSWLQDKGHNAGFQAFVHAVRSGAESPIPFESLVNTTRATLTAAGAVLGQATMHSMKLPAAGLPATRLPATGLPATEWPQSRNQASSNTSAALRHGFQPDIRHDIRHAERGGCMIAEKTAGAPAESALATPWRKAARWGYLLRHHHPSQLAMRLFRMAQGRTARGLWQRRMASAPVESPTLRANAPLAALSRRKLAARAERAESREAAERIMDGRFCFLHREIALPDPIDWRLADAEAAHLWRFHLHYQDYLLDLGARAMRQGECRWRDRAWGLVLDWMDANRLDDGRVLADAWHPYCISRRLPAWIHLWAAGPPEEDVRPRVLHGMIWQARYLMRHLEWDLRGNHLLENLRALALLGAFFDGKDANQALAMAAALLPGQLAEQVLEAGEHFERSPRYHADMLEALLDLRDALAGILPELAAQCGATAAKMAALLGELVHPDGDVPLLGDSCLGQAEPVASLLRWAEEDTRVSRQAARHAVSPARVVGDYWRFRDAGDFLLFDAGPVGADSLPAHAHADLLTLEASVGGRRLLVDGGVFSYEDEPVRRYCRSTAAHNVLQVDGADQCDVYSRFRMGYRGWPSPLEAGEQHGFAWARAWHNAYRRLGVPQVGRWLACRPGGPWFCVDWARGDGHHRLTSWLHFHPEAEIAQVDDRTLAVSLASQSLQVHWLGPGTLGTEEGWYCPSLGIKQKATVARWEAALPLPAALGWWLSWNGCEGAASLTPGRGGGPVLAWKDGGGTFEFHLEWPSCPR